MLGQTLDFALALAPQGVADHREERYYYAVYQIVAAHEEVGRLGCHAQSLEVGLERFVGGAALRELALQLRDLRIHAAAQGFKRALGMVEVEVVEGNDVGEVE